MRKRMVMGGQAQDVARRRGDFLRLFVRARR